jgi:hypothetical protein
LASRSGGHGMKNADLPEFPPAMADILREFTIALRHAREAETARLHNVIHGLEILLDGMIELRAEVQAWRPALEAVQEKDR